jgi:hypothetical protein
LTIPVSGRRIGVRISVLVAQVVDWELSRPTVVLVFGQQPQLVFHTLGRRLEGCEIYVPQKMVGQRIRGRTLPVDQIRRRPFGELLPLGLAIHRSDARW